MLHKRGFTLIELLVVIAIIAILAAIAIPRIQNAIARARVTRAIAEINGIQTAIAQLMIDADVKSIEHMFTDFPKPTTAELDVNTVDPDVIATTLQDYEDAYTELLYTLLRKGKETDLAELVSPEFAAFGTAWNIDQNKLASSYMTDLAQDPWGMKYRFWPGMITKTLRDTYDYDQDPDPVGVTLKSVQFVPYRAFRADPDPLAGYPFYLYDAAAKVALDTDLPGNPPADGLPGVPAPKDLAVYVYSTGENKVSDQVYNRTLLTAAAAAPPGTTWDLLLPALVDPTDPAEIVGTITSPVYTAEQLDYLGGGDDINNWDREDGWTEFTE
ncbi:MAG TPA: prepilin-type N-terminal cleavage/methylation domain-containing protein [Candidatus Hydrogenedentes bacterium]|nr:prepilin-type N-terminal cleavage/methylation domain-containing protein [Candidatus Hydrogenedentota bacterium]